MKDQRGITLIELLVTITLLGIIVIPILTLMTGTFTNTVSQGKESQIQYFAQEVVETARISTYPDGLENRTIYGICSANLGCSEIDPTRTVEPEVNDGEIIYKILFRSLVNVTTDPEVNQRAIENFYEIEVFLKSAEPNSQEVAIVTVVKRQ